MNKQNNQSASVQGEKMDNKISLDSSHEQWINVVVVVVVVILKGTNPDRDITYTLSPRYSQKPFVNTHTKSQQLQLTYI